MRRNNAINTDSKKQRSFVAPLFTAGYGERYEFSPDLKIITNADC